jgi:NADPH:quinone reductase-like Zn-dependent oxidoreductase
MSSALRNSKKTLLMDLSCRGWLRFEQDAAAGVPLIVKTASQGGRYITGLADRPVFEVSSVWDFVWKMAHPALWRAIKSRTLTRNTLPSYTLALLGPQKRVVMTQTLQLASEGKLQPVMDERGPFLFTTEGVQAAFRLQKSRHAHGKVVIHVAEGE